MGWKQELPSTSQTLLILAVESASCILFLTCHSVPLSGYDAGLEQTLLTRKQPTVYLYTPIQEHGFSKCSVRASPGTGGDTQAEPLEQQQLVSPLGLTPEASPRSKCVEAKLPRPAGSEPRCCAPAQGAQRPSQCHI